MELIGTKGQGEKETTRRMGPKNHVLGTEAGIYMSLHGRFASRQHDGQIGQKNRKVYSSQPGHSGNTNNDKHGFHDAVRRGRPIYEAKYSSTCCGKCKHFLRPWRSGVWVCSNGESKKNGFPTNYASTCPLFAREDWQ